MSDPEFQVTDELAGFIEALHDSEIDGEISWFFDRVWGVRIGDRFADSGRVVPAWMVERSHPDGSSDGCCSGTRVNAVLIA